MIAYIAISLLAIIALYLRGEFYINRANNLEVQLSDYQDYVCDLDPYCDMLERRNSYLESLHSYSKAIRAGNMVRTNAVDAGAVMCVEDGEL